MKKIDLILDVLLLAGLAVSILFMASLTAVIVMVIGRCVLG